MRVHVGCGSVFLRGWFNIDLPGPRTFLASQRPDLVEKWGTTDEDYFAKHKDKNQNTLKKPLEQEYVCDRFGSFDNLPVPAWTATEVLARHSFEHLSITEAHKALDQLDEIMKENGVLRLDVPDHEQTLKLYKKTGDDFYMRHLLGPRRNDHGFHMMSYDRQRLRALVEHHGFVYVGEEPNIHFYPAFCLRFVKPGPRAPFEYMDAVIPKIPDSWRVAEIGPGSYPFPRANVYIDKHAEPLNALTAKGQHTVFSDLEKGLPEIDDQSFDFVYCSHVLEHITHVDKAVAGLNRISKRGMIVMPSFAKESLGWFEENDHAWLVLPHPETNNPVFVRRHSRFTENLRNTELQKISCHQFRTGPNRRGEIERYSRKWWYENEHLLDVVAKWDEQHPLTVQVIA